jgi:hypothetical protein
VGAKAGWCAGALGPMTAGDREPRRRREPREPGRAGCAGTRGTTRSWARGLVRGRGDARRGTGRLRPAPPGPPCRRRETSAGLRADRSGGGVTLSWDGSCVATDADYAVYEGALGAFTSHVPRLCSTAGARSAALALPAGDAYWLVVPRNAAAEGSYGQDGGGAERPPAVAACLPASVAACPVDPWAPRIRAGASSASPARPGGCRRGGARASARSARRGPGAGGGRCACAARGGAGTRSTARRSSARRSRPIAARTGAGGRPPPRPGGRWRRPRAGPRSRMRTAGQRASR